MPTTNTPSNPPIWNTGFKIGPKKAFQAKEVWEIRFHLRNRGLVRDRALFDLAIDSKLRGCDLVKIRIGDIAAGGETRRRASVIQQQTGRPAQVEVPETARESLTAWLKVRGGSQDFVFPSRLTRCPHIGTRQYARLVNEWVAAIGLPTEEYGTHSLRRMSAGFTCQHIKPGRWKIIEHRLPMFAFW